MTFGAWFKDFLKRNKIKQNYFAEKSGFTTKMVNLWACGYYVPNGHSFVIIATTLAKITNINRPIILEQMANSICPLY